MPAIMLRVLVTTWLAAFLVVSASCKRDQPGEAGAARRVEAPGQPQVTSPSTLPAQPPPDARPALAESDVQALVERWRVAQNDGDFDAYAALYGDGFEGVKRAGEAEQRFDRAGWLEDRKRMFARPMHVDVDELRVDMAARGARVELVQTWSSGGFGDRGRKRLDLELREGGLRIVREEMLDSRIVVTEMQCLQMLFPGYRAASRRVDAEPDAARVESVEVVEPNQGKDRFVCLVRTFEPNEDDKGGSGEFTLALLVRKGRRWSVAARQEHAFTVDDSSEETGESSSASAKLEVEAIAPEENAIVHTIEERQDGPMMADTKERVVLYRVTGTSLEELLALESSSSGGEGDSATRETFTIDTDSVSNGLYDIQVERVRTEDNWHANEHSEHRNTDRYQWDGSAYEQVGY
jgi:ketosteroid isomerase-like protein